MATINGTGGNNTLSGGDDPDDIFGGGGADSLSGAGGNDSVFGGTGNDTLNGDDGDDILDGGSNTDRLFGGIGNDTLIGGTGNDSLVGGDGIDTASYASSGAGVNVNLATGGATGGAGTDTLAEIENVVGSGSNDTLTGSDGANRLEGGGGADSISGGDGDDTLAGGGGNDTLSGGNGNDTADFSSATGGLNVNLTAGTATGEGTDTLSSIESAIGGSGNDTLTGSNGANRLEGGGGADSISGGDGDDTLAGGAGNDTLSGGAGTDTADFSASATGVTVNLDTGTATGEGTDTLSSIENATGSAQADSITGTSADNLLDGGAGNDTITGGLGSDTINGGDGNDQIAAGPEAGSTAPLVFAWDDFADETNLAAGVTQSIGGIDVGVSYSGGVSGATFSAETSGLVGGGDRESPIFVGSGEPFNASSSAELFRPADGGINSSSSITFDFSTAAGSGLEGTVSNVQFRISDIDRSGFTDAVTVRAFDADGNEIAVTITETSASLSVSGNTVTATGAAVLPNDAAGSVLYQIAGPVASFIIEYTDLNNAQQAIRVSDIHFDAVATDDDLVDAGDGDDTVTGGTGDDTLIGGAGDDSLTGGEGDDSLDGGDGQDTLEGGAGADALFGGDETDTIRGGDGNDTIDGGENTDDIFGDDGDDLIVDTGGSLSDDTIFGGDGNDTVLGGAREDLISGDAGNDSLSGEAGDDTIDGGSESDTLFGGAGNDSLIGGSGADSLDGGEGDDILDGGADGDTLAGGLGNDTFLGGLGDVVDGSEDPGDGDNDVLDLRAFGKALTNITFAPGDPESGTVEFLDSNGDVIGSMTFSNIETVIPCFTPGTLIDTERGPRRVETLRAGDRVLTRDNGFQPVRWVGRRDLGLAEVIARPALGPVRIAAGALGQGLPHRCMTVSPQHRVLVTSARAELLFGEREVLVPAGHLAGRPGITRPAPAPVSYLHLLLDRHEILRSDGAWTESFQPGSQTLDGMEAGPRAELMALFPELAAGAPYEAARVTLKAYETRVLLAA